MPSGYLPQNDTQFSAWLDNFNSWLETHFAEVGLTAADLDALNDEHPLWDVALAAHVTAQQAAKSATSVKNDRRTAIDTLVRSLVARINAYPGTTDGERDILGIRNPVPSTAQGEGIPADDKPLAIIDVSARLKHVVRVQNVTNTGTQRAKPANAIGCELWRKVGEQPSTVEDMDFVGLVTRTPIELEYPGTDGGKQVYYALRWVSSKGEKGSWSETDSATIAA